jgi:hypothetical protein
MIGAGWVGVGVGERSGVGDEVGLGVIVGAMLVGVGVSASVGGSVLAADGRQAVIAGRKRRANTTNFADLVSICISHLKVRIASLYSILTHVKTRK